MSSTLKPRSTKSQNAQVRLRGCLKSPGRSRLTVRESGFVPAARSLEWRNIVGENDGIGTFQTRPELRYGQSTPPRISEYRMAGGAAIGQQFSFGPLGEGVDHAGTPERSTKNISPVSLSPENSIGSDLNIQYWRLSKAKTRPGKTGG